ncbi:MAG: SRPBCC family protein [Gammaproteobacteria bacterium]|nr:SRPBCC family protein [Gammaproteobacteria bacterium]
MANVKMSSHFSVAPDQVWDLIGGFNALADWHPAVEKSELEEGGTIRRLHLVGGGEIVERLQQSDDDKQVYSYSILEGPLPVQGYVAEIRVRPDGDGCEVEWSSSFEPAGASESDAMQAIQDVYQAGFDNLKKIFGMR